MADKVNKMTSLEEELASRNASHEFLLKELQSKSACLNESVFLTNQAELDTARESLDRFAKLSVEWEQSRITDRETIVSLQRKCSEFEVLQSDRELLEDRIRVLELELDTEKDLKSEKTVMLMRELELARAESERNYTAFHSINLLKEEESQARLKTERRLKELELSLFNAQEDVESLQEELDRLKAIEEKVFKEKEDLKTQMAIANEERTKLVQKIGSLEGSYEKLVEENAKLAGHQNLRQKIQTLMVIKRENQELKQELDLIAKECSCNSYERVSKEVRLVREKEPGRDKESKKKPLGSRNSQSSSFVMEKKLADAGSTPVGKENISMEF